MKNVFFWLYLIFILLFVLYIGALYKSEAEPIQEIEQESEQEITIEPVKTQEYIEPPPEQKKTFLGVYTIYAYCPCKKCCGKDNGITATGVKAVEGRTVAANLPFGTKLYIDGIGERIVEDRGGGIKTQSLDVFFNSHNEALIFGKKKVEVWQIE